ncbi:signal peptide peptidase-domain-containing protein [Neohortaea acidophila]|uniref:Signal peptide peptidase-domain-containing protein n=1 Tax=Neohortaea acidophila TaxID=245834 RepID=A0A6A6PI06_9PEZI|nr:signal peptide peptidase-domain-containing protein [Neohortaea acidophila]KAF2479678.1 signal peptide peptidase-domain-containing protein [Neohortaea acidophila]
MSSPDHLSHLLAKAALHFHGVRPLLPMYLHLILSALFPIYAGAHASLSRPSSAAKAPRKTKKATDSDDDDVDEDKVQKMEGLSNTDAIILPVTAGITLTVLYFLIKKYGADVVNLIMGYYFAGVGVFSVGQLVNDAANLGVGFVFPTYYCHKGSLYKVNSRERRVVRQDESNAAPETRSSPLPGALGSLASALRLDGILWTVRRILKQKLTIKAYVKTIIDMNINVTIINLASAFAGAATIVYVNTVAKPWFLTNVQGFAVSYSALQLLSPTTFATGSLILSALFFYDIWAVFFTPLMIAVATNLDQPIKMVFPRPDEPSEIPGEPPTKNFSMLGLGDIVIPGIMIGLALRFDLYMFYLKKQKKSRSHSAAQSPSRKASKTAEERRKAPYVPVTGRWGDRFWTSGLLFSSSPLPDQLRTSFPKPYFTASVVGYVVGMITTVLIMTIYHHGQPALLYLVPGVLISLWGTALVRGELHEMCSFSEAVNAVQVEERSEEGKDKVEEEVKEEKQPRGLFERLWWELWRADDDEKGKKAKEGEKSSESEKEKNKTSNEKEEKEKEGVFFSFSISRQDPRASAKASSRRRGRSVAYDDGLAEASPRRAARSPGGDVVSSPEVQNTGVEETPRLRARSTRAASSRRR